MCLQRRLHVSRLCYSHVEFRKRIIITQSRELKMCCVLFSTLPEEGYNGSNSSDSDDARNGSSKSLSIKIPIERRSYFQAPEKFRKTLRLTSEQIVSSNFPPNIFFEQVRSQFFHGSQLFNAVRTAHLMRLAECLFTV